MLCSTLSRFQGGICGSLIPESLMTLPEDQENLNCSANTLAIFWSKSLIESDDSNLTNYRSLENLTTSEMAIASLPLILFGHESSQLLTEKLTLLKQSPETLTELLIWGKAIALAMRGTFTPVELLEELLKEKTQTKLEQQLEQIINYLKQNYSLTQVVQQLSRRKEPQETAMAIALYCFAYTPTDFALGINRAIYSGYQPAITSALTGALIGVYNGYQNIPLSLRINLDRHCTWQTSRKIAGKLYARWCGVAQPVSESWFSSAPAIAQAASLQTRPQLKIISQRDS